MRIPMEKRREGLCLAELGPPRLLHPDAQSASVPVFKCHIPEILLRDHYCPIGPSIQREYEDGDTLIHINVVRSQQHPKAYWGLS